MTDAAEKNDKTPEASYGPTYLDFITPDDVFDQGPRAVEQWKRGYVESLQMPNPNPPVSPSLTGDN